MRNTAPAPAAHTLDALAAATSRQAGTDLLTPLTRSQLVAVAVELSIVHRGLNKSSLVARIVESTVGAREDAATIREACVERCSY